MEMIIEKISSAYTYIFDIIIYSFKIILLIALIISQAHL
jgi:hypothetical protein